MKIKFAFFGLLVFLAQNLLAQNDSNKLDENGKKHGLWKGFYEESKRPRYEGSFDHGKEIGVFNFYDDTKAKSIIATREFNTNDDSAYTTFFDQKKNKVSEGKEVGRKYDGQWKYYHKESKEIMSLDNYKDGKLDGKRTVFYPNGKIAEEMYFKSGVKEGPYKSYTDTGIVIEESNYKNGEYDGPAIYRESTGQKASEGKYVKGKKRGIWKLYKEGKLFKQQNMSRTGPNKLGDSRAAKVESN